MVMQHKVTADEFEAFIQREDNAERRFELINGEIVEKLPTQEHGIIVLKIGARLLVYVETHKSGRVSVETRHRQPGDPFNDRIPDISYVVGTDEAVVRKGPMPRLPDLAVEVKSPDDSYTHLREKAAYYLENGVSMVWLVYPEKQLVEIYQPDADIQILTVGDTINGAPLLPGFTLSIADIFAV